MNLTREQILEEPAGDRLNAWIERYVIQSGQIMNFGGMVIYPPYSTDISAAWEVVEKIRKIDKYWCPRIEWDDDDGDSDGFWRATFQYFGEDHSKYKWIDEIANTAPMAICRAALLAKLEEADA